jgi:uncharacterized membrane protein YdjX (TVP38/TMEM64 family)
LARSPLAHFIFRGLIVIGVLALVSYLLGDVLDQGWIDAYVRGHGLSGELLFLMAGWLLSSVGLSRQLIAFLGGYAFGFLPGVLLASLAVVGGCMLCFFTARYLLRTFLLQHYAGRIDRMGRFVHDNTFVMTLLIRLLPLGSNLMVNVAAGVSGVRSIPFFMGSAIGYLPQTLIFALVGSGTGVDRFWQVAVAMGLFVVATVLGIWLYRKYRQGMSLDPQLDEELGVNESGLPADRQNGPA